MSFPRLGTGIPVPSEPRPPAFSWLPASHGAPLSQFCLRSKRLPLPGPQGTAALGIEVQPLGSWSQDQDGVQTARGLGGKLRAQRPGDALGPQQAVFSPWAWLSSAANAEDEPHGSAAGLRVPHSQQPNPFAKEGPPESQFVFPRQAGPCSILH